MREEGRKPNSDGRKPRKAAPRGLALTGHRETQIGFPSLPQAGCPKLCCSLTRIVVAKAESRKQACFPFALLRRDKSRKPFRFELRISDFFRRKAAWRPRRYTRASVFGSRFLKSETLYPPSLRHGAASVVSDEFLKPRFGGAGKFHRLAAPEKAHGAGVQGGIFRLLILGNSVDWDDHNADQTNCRNDLAIGMNSKQ